MRLAAVVLAVLALPAGAAAEVKAASFDSAALGRKVAVNVQLPPSYAVGGTFPVLYVLHGLFESQDFWEKRGLAAAVEKRWRDGSLAEFLVVAVDGGNSFFLNGPLGRFQDLVTQDLVAYVESTYRVRPGREGRALLGISMGGYAALRIALSHPEVFGTVAAHSAMLLTQIPSEAEGAGRWHMAAFRAAFGSPIDAALWAAADPLALAERADPKVLPAIYFDCGQQDRYGLFEGNQELHRRLEKRGVAHEFALHPGSHGYEYVHTVLDLSLSFVGTHLGPPARSPAPRR